MNFFTSIIPAILFSIVLEHPCYAQTAPPLGAAQSFAVLGAATVTNTGPTVVTGDVGVSPGSAVTGFPPGKIVSGQIYSGAASAAGAAQASAVIAYNYLVAESAPPANNLTGIDLGGKTLNPGVYTFSSSAQLTGTLTLNDGGNPNAIFIFKIGSTITTASYSKVLMSSGGYGPNVYWQIGSSATIGTYTNFLGNIIAMASITMTTGATETGRLYALNGAVTFDTNNPGASTLTCGAGPTLAVTQPVCNVSLTGSIVANSAGATGYSLDGGPTQTSGAFSGIAAGIHSVAAINGSCSPASSFTINGQMYTWSGATGTDPAVATNWVGGIAPPFDGTASLVIPITLTGNYPMLTANASVFNLSINGITSSFGLNGFTINTACDIFNSVLGGVFSYNSNLNSTLNWNGTSPTQTYVGNVLSNAATLGNMVVNNTGGGTLTIGSGPMNIYNKLTVTKGSLLIDPLSVITLKSTATQTASVTAIPTGSTIMGKVSVERFITGGSSIYRGYRLFSSPVNISANTAGGGNVSLKYINTSVINGNAGAFTAGPGGTANGFTIQNNFPTMYLYDESQLSSNSGFTSGKNAGIMVIGDTTVSVLQGITTTPHLSIPVGNSYLFYFVGANTLTTGAATPAGPASTTITAIGTLNQGVVKVKVWKNGSVYGSPNLSYTTGTGTGITGGVEILGLNQIGNPYASTISLQQLYADNNVGLNAINPNFYELDEKSKSYLTYNANLNISNNTRAGKYIASGQGFMAGATAANQTLTFRETQKIDTNLTNSAGTSPALFMALKPTTANAFAGLHLQLSKDSAITQTGIYFSAAWSDKYSGNQDAYDINGLSSPLLLSSFTSDGFRVSINLLGDYIGGKRVKLFVHGSVSGQYNLGLADIVRLDTIYNVLLVDNLLKDSVNLRKATYNFTINPADTTTFGANRFVMVIALKPLPPYKLLSFTGQKNSTNIQLAWKTTNEGYYTGFVLQRQAGALFTDIDSLQGNSSASYSYTDINPVKGINNYRLKQIDAAGNISYSAIVTVNTDTNAPVLSVYPNPVHDNITVTINLAPAPYKITIYNSLGSPVKQASINSNSWTDNIANYNPGTYIVQVSDKKGKYIAMIKFVKVQ